MLANVHATLCYVLGTSKQKNMAKIGKTCLTEEALAPIGGSRSKYLFFFSRHARSGGGGSGGTVYRVHHQVQQGLSHQNAPAQKGEAVPHTHSKAKGEQWRFSLF